MTAKTHKKPEVQLIAEELGVSEEQVIQIVTRVLKSLHQQSRGEMQTTSALLHAFYEYGEEVFYHLGGVLYESYWDDSDSQRDLSETMMRIAPGIFKRFPPAE